MASSQDGAMMIFMMTVMLLILGGGALLYVSQDDEDSSNTNGGTVTLPGTANLPGDYPVVTDPEVLNRDCSVDQAVYRNVEGPCYDSNGNVMTGIGQSCGTGTTRRILDTTQSTGFVAARGTGTCDILQDDNGVCEVPCPRNCEGGTWSTGGTCVRINEDGEEVALFDGGRLSDGTCGPGQVKKFLIKTDDFVASQGLGTCQFSTTEPCYRKCTDDQGREISAEFVGVCGYSGIKAKDRDIGSRVLGHEGCVKKDENDEPVKDDDGNYVPVGEGEKGVARWYEAALYGDTTKCNDLVTWRECDGPRVPTDCVGGWIDQGECERNELGELVDPNCDPKWSACYLRINPQTGLTPTHGATYRKKEYLITTPASEGVLGGLRAGKACEAEVELEGGATQKREFKPGDPMVFEQQCPQEQWVDECTKTEWKLDTSRGSADTNHCVLDENDENPTQRYTRSVTGACGPDDDPYDKDDLYGNKEEKFVGCCYKSKWIDAGTLSEGNQPQTREVKNCTVDDDLDDPHGIDKTRDIKMCEVEDWENKVPKEDSSGNVIGCQANGYKPFTRKVYNAELCRDKGIDASVEMNEECCYQGDWVLTDVCGPNGKLLKRRTVQDGPANQSGLCTSAQEVTEMDSDQSCCLKQQETEPVGECGSDGFQEYRYKTTGDCEGTNVSAPSKRCCFASDEQWGPWAPEDGATCVYDENLGKETIDVKRTREVVNKYLCGDDVKTEEKDTFDCGNCVGHWEGAGHEFKGQLYNVRLRASGIGHQATYRDYQYYASYGKKFKYVHDKKVTPYGKDCEYADGLERTDWQKDEYGDDIGCFINELPNTNSWGGYPQYAGYVVCPGADDKPGGDQTTTTTTSSTDNSDKRDYFGARPG